MDLIALGGDPRPGFFISYRADAVEDPAASRQTYTSAEADEVLELRIGFLDESDVWVKCRSKRTCANTAWNDEDFDDTRGVVECMNEYARFAEVAIRDWACDAR